MAILNVPLAAPTRENTGPFDLGETIFKAMQARNQAAQARKQELENPFVTRIQQELLKKNQIENQYAPRMNEADIGFKNANAGHLTAETKWMPTKYDIERMNAETARGKYAVGINNTLLKWTQTPEGEKALQGDPALAKSVLQAIRQSASSFGYQNDQGSSQQPVIQQGNQPSVNQPNPRGPMDTTGLKRNDLVQIANADQAKYDQQNNIKPYQSIPEKAAEQQTQQDYGKKKTEDELVREIQRGAADHYEKMNLPADIKKRLYAGDRFKATTPLVLKDFQLARNYFSPAGYEQYLKDEAKTWPAGKVPVQLQAMRRFKQGLEQLKVQGAMLEGVPADKKSRADYAAIYDLPRFLNSPEDAQNLLNNAINLGLIADKANKSSLSELMQQDNQTAESLGRDDVVTLIAPDGTEVPGILRSKVKDAIQKHPGTKIKGE